MSRLIAVMGRLTGDNDTAAALQLLLQMAMLADNLANLREAQQRLHQAHAARHAADRLRTVAAIIPTPAYLRQQATGPSYARVTPAPELSPRNRTG